MVDATVRYALDLTGAAYSKENLLIGFMAHAELTGKSFPSRGTVATLADKIGLEHHRYDELAQSARALAASTVDIETDTDIDIAASIIAADPKAFEPRPEPAAPPATCSCRD